jgi:hypothetical protein
MIEAIANIFWRRKDNHFCRKFNRLSSTLLLAFLLLVLRVRWGVTCARLIRFGDGFGIFTSSDSENMRRITEGKPGSSTLELVELCRVIEYGSIHFGAVLHEVGYSYAVMSAIPADEIPIMAGIWFCLHSSAFISLILINRS